MTQMNEWEKRLQSWIPRHPSARLERRIFGARSVPDDEVHLLRFSWVPLATAVLALMCVLFNQRQGARFSARGTVGPMVAMILSNQSAAAYLPGSFQAEQNRLPTETLQWSSRRGATHKVALPLESRDIKEP